MWRSTKRVVVACVASVGWLGWLASASAADRPYAALPPAERVAADISAFGADEVLHERLWPDRRVFDALLNQIEAGDSRWLNIAAALRAASDAGASEALAGALSGALARQPKNVLRVLSPGAAGSSFTVADVCAARFAFIEQPVAQQRWRVEVSQALAAEHDAKLAPMRDACLAALPPIQ